MKDKVLLKYILKMKFHEEGIISPALRVLMEIRGPCPLSLVLLPDRSGIMDKSRRPGNLSPISQNTLLIYLLLLVL